MDSDPVLTIPYWVAVVVLGALAVLILGLILETAYGAHDDPDTPWRDRFGDG